MRYFIESAETKEANQTEIMNKLKWRKVEEEIVDLRPLYVEVTAWLFFYTRASQERDGQLAKWLDCRLSMEI